MIQRKKSLSFWFVAPMAAFFLVASAQAAPSFDPQDYTSFTQDYVNEAVELIGIGSAHSPYSSATPLGYAVGLDVGFSVTAIGLTDTFKEALEATGAKASPPAYVPLPRLQVSKGLPFGIDIGASYIGIDEFKIFGGHVQWAFLKGNLALPSIAARVGYSSAEVFFAKSKAMSLDVVASKKLGFFLDPYAGIGVQRISGEIEVPVGETLGDGTLKAEHSKVSPRVFFGLPVKLVFLQITGQYEYSFTGMSNFGAKLSLNF